MWVTKLKIKHKCKISPRCKKFSVTCYSILLNRFKEKGIFYLSGQHYLVGEEKNIKGFITDLKKDKGTKQIEIKGNIIVMLERAEKTASLYFDPKIFYIKPVQSNPEGFEFWELGAWEKEILMDFINKLKKTMDFLEIKKLVKSKLSEVYFPMVVPKLTKQQKRALEIAIENGYYTYPRKIKLEKLAKLIGVSLSTYQEHLRKAESKILLLFPKIE